MMRLDAEFMHAHVVARGYGADAICPGLALETVAHEADENEESELSGPEILELTSYGAQKLSETPNASWAPKVRENLTQLEAEVKRREAQLLADAPEPGGSDAEAAP